MRSRLALAVVAAATAVGAAEPPAPRPFRLAPSAEDRAAPPTPRPDRRPAPERLAALDPRPRIDPGALCADARLRGAEAAAPGASGGCGIERPVRLAAASGVALDPPPLVDCAVASRLADWIDGVVQPAARAEAGSTVTGMRVFAGYACRGRNNQRMARMSLHGRGLAIDIGTFRFADGREIAVLDGWRGTGSAFLRAAWRGACGPFGTVLGPNADRFHANHFHLDVADYRSGPVCR